MEHFIVFVIAVLLSAFGLSFLGAVAGLLAKGQSSGGAIGTPLLLITMLPPLFSDLNDMLTKIAVIVPTTSFQTVYLSTVNGESLTAKDNMIALAVCVVWIVAGYTVFHVFYKRKGIDY